MTTYSPFSDVPGLQVEVEDGGGGAIAAPSLAGLLDGLRPFVTQVSAQLEQLPANQRPTKLSLAFGVRALSGGFAVAMEADLANFQVSLVWSQEPPGPEPDIPGFPGL